MRYALASFDDESGEMEPALYCRACAEGFHAEGFHWETVLLNEDEAFRCDHCSTAEADETPINGSAWLQDELEPRLNGKRLAPR